MFLFKILFVIKVNSFKYRLVFIVFYLCLSFIIVIINTLLSPSVQTPTYPTCMATKHASTSTSLLTRTPHLHERPSFRHPTDFFYPPYLHEKETSPFTHSPYLPNILLTSLLPFSPCTNHLPEHYQALYTHLHNQSLTYQTTPLHRYNIHSPCYHLLVIKCKGAQ